MYKKYLVMGIVLMTMSSSSVYSMKNDNWRVFLSNIKQGGKYGAVLAGCLTLPTIVANNDLSPKEKCMIPCLAVLLSGVSGSILGGLSSLLPDKVWLTPKYVRGPVAGTFTGAVIATSIWTLFCLGSSQQGSRGIFPV